jgi:hypothetical protein
LQQVNQRSQMRPEGPGMGPGPGFGGGGGIGPGGRRPIDMGSFGVASSKTALLAGLTLGSPDFQRR